MSVNLEINKLILEMASFFNYQRVRFDFYQCQMQPTPLVPDTNSTKSQSNSNNVYKQLPDVDYTT